MPKKSKLKKAKASIISQDPPKTEYYNQPQSSPYEAPLVTIYIGSKKYGIPACYLRKYPQWDKDFNRLYVNPITLSEFVEEVGHTIVHFLYTGEYETLRSETESDGSYAVKEYGKSILAYYAARLHSLEGLEVLANKYMDIFGSSLSIVEILQAVKPVLLNFDAEDWFRDYVRGKLRDAFVLDENVFKSGDFYTGLGGDLAFNEAVMKMIVDIYSAEVASLRNSLEDQKKSVEREVNGQAAEDEFVVDEVVIEDSVEDLVDDAPPAEDVQEDLAAPSVEDTWDMEAPIEEVLAEDAPVEDAPVEDAPVEDAPVEDAPAEEATVEDAPAEEATVEDAWGEVALVEDATVEDAPDEDAPVEDAPDEDALIQDVAVEQVPAEDYAAVPPADEYPIDAPAEDGSSPSDTVADVNLYKNWKTISHKKRLKRTKLLRRRGLPVPNKDGTFSELCNGSSFPEVEVPIETSEIVVD